MPRTSNQSCGLKPADRQDGEQGDDNGIGDDNGLREQLDGEPSLGWTDMEARYSRYAASTVVDGESEHDGREPDVDREPDGDEDDGSEDRLRSRDARAK